MLATTPDTDYASRSAADFDKRYRRRFGPITNYAVNSSDAASALIEAISAAEQKTGAQPNRSEVLESVRCPRSLPSMIWTASASAS